ncbi:MAG TPA: hypothetical protein VM124_01185 [Candidatus Limnocylindrales bacterium]|nr:hypothetical protein [Candidatus Limnocylindrales bacterium]
MSAQAQPRGSLIRPFEGFPAYGAVHDVIPNQQLRGLLFDFSRLSDEVFQRAFQTEEVELPGYEPEEGFTAEPITCMDAAQGTYDPRRFYRIFDIERLGVSVVEMDPSARAARAVRAIWEGQDFGAVENEARNEMGRTLPIMRPRLFFNRVEGVGRRMPGVPKEDVRQKLALMPDTNRFIETHELIEEEADIIINAITRRLRQFTYPWDTIPSLAFAAFRPAAQPDQIVEVKNKTNEYLAKHPFGLALGQLTFRYKKQRGRRRQ